MLGEIEGRGKRGQRGQDCWMASPTQWTRVWANSGRGWRTGKPGVLQSMGLWKSQVWFVNWATTTIPSFQGWCEDEITQGRLLALGLTCCKDSRSIVFIYLSIFRACQACGLAGKESACNAGDLGLIPGLGRSPGEGKGSPLLYSGLENSMDYI